MTARDEASEVEVELKIKLSPADLEKVFLILREKVGLSEIKHKFSSRAYYDTPDLGLYNKGLSLRVQEIPGKSGNPGGYEQTLKMEVLPDQPLKESVMMRRECRDNISTHIPSLAAVSDPQAQEAVKSFRDKSLVPIFTSAIERRYFEMELDHGAVELAFDVGKLILAEGGWHQDFSEIEIEVKRGDADLIDIVKKEILRIAPSGAVQPLSKSAQGSQLYLKYKKQPPVNAASI